MSAETGAVQSVTEELEVAVEQPVVEQEQQEQVQEVQKEEQVPLSALQKERRKRQETERELSWHKEQMMRKQEPVEPDESHLEAATREDLGKAEQKIMRSVEERTWIKHNPERAQEVNEKLTEFLTLRPNLASAIEGATNRYEEAWMLMDALTPKQKAALKPTAPARKDAPGNPSGMPKAAGMNQSVDVMGMNDSEFNAWRKSQRKRR